MEERGWVSRHGFWPLALGCRRGARWAGVELGALTVAASVSAGLLGPVGIVPYAVYSAFPSGLAGGG